jgi:cytosine/uracil/thiamine/allantoin permease
VLRLGHSLVEGFAAILVGAALFLAIMSFGWSTRGGHQRWKIGFPTMIREGHSPN